LKHFILDKDKKVVPASFYEWTDFIGHFPNKKVAQTQLENCFISTIFTGIDTWNDSNYFETIVFDNKEHDMVEQEYYGTYEKALKGHETIVERYKKELRNETR